MGTPYEFDLDQEMRDAIEVTLAPEATKAKRKYILDIGVDKEGLPEPVGKKHIWFRKGRADLQKGEEWGAQGPCPRNPRYPPCSGHVQVPPIQRKTGHETEDYMSKSIAKYFNHIFDIANDYKRLTFDSLSDPLSTKRDITSSTREAPRTAAPPSPIAPIEEGDGDSEGGGESSGGSPPLPPASKPPVPNARRAARKAVKAPAPQRKPPPINNIPVAQSPRARLVPQTQPKTELATRCSE
jgi:hypothetical protein